VEWKAELDADALVGCVYSNEFVDALPVHRVVARATGLRELFVAVRKGALVMEEGEPSTSALVEYLARYGVPLRNGQQAEINLAALGWIEQVAAKLERGFLLTIDYGYLAPELYSPARLGGTLLAYRAHRASEDVLVCPGAQDLTAHVNFSALIEHGREVGLLPLGFTSQAKFLLALGKENEFADLYAPQASELERYQARLHLKQLIYPEGMGEIFRILVQGKGVGPVGLTGLGDT
jgi:SAM-dependent MidA family methyltransferase